MRELRKKTPHARFDEGGVETGTARVHGPLLASRREFLLGILAAAQVSALNGAELDMPAGVNPLESDGAAKPYGAGRFEFGKDGTFTFLMITDWHRRTKKSDTAREIALFRKAVARFSPSLVVFGGDNISGGTGCNRRGVFEITQAQWKNIATNSTLSANFTEDGKMRPMEKVSWNNINSYFLGLLNNKTGLDFTLPSEAQWEFAARAGHGSGYWNNGSPIEIDGEKDDNLALLARYKHNLGGLDSTPTLAPSEGGTTFVGTYLPNSWGLYDMHGNVWEWCLDLYAADITTLNGAVNTSGSTRVLRGGCWNNLADVCRPAYRWDLNPNTRYQYCGFRVLCTAGLQ